MQFFLRTLLVILSIYILVSVIYMIWAVIYRPEQIDEKGEYSFKLYYFSDKKYLLRKILFLGAFLGYVIIIGAGAYQLLYWVPYLSGSDIDGDWNSTRRWISYLFGCGVGGATYLQLSLHGYNQYMKSIKEPN
ncbi:MULTISPECIES: hypothetical protein [Methylotenera]|uniref:hypothetical protein n=1 Tax=Methylotenera TaxID=359407 RepID=UPI00036B8BB6|nr:MULTISPECIES: hypothetical protein [Methylotenera]